MKWRRSGGQQPCRRGVKTWQGLIPGQRAHHCQHHDTHWAARRHSPAWPAAVPAAPSVTVWLVLLSSPSPPCPIAICSPNKMAATQHRAHRPATCQCPARTHPKALTRLLVAGGGGPHLVRYYFWQGAAGYALLFAVGWYMRFPPTWFAAVWWHGRLCSPRQPPSGVGLHLLALLFIFRFSTFQGIVILHAFTRGRGKQRSVQSLMEFWGGKNNFLMPTLQLVSQFLSASHKNLRELSERTSQWHTRQPDKLCWILESMTYKITQVQKI